MTSQPVSIRLTDKLRGKLKSWAADEQRSFAGHCAWLLEQAVKWREQQKPPSRGDKK